MPAGVNNLNTVRKVILRRRYFSTAGLLYDEEVDNLLLETNDDLLQEDGTSVIFLQGFKK